jgi:hypothetical protein
MSELEELHKLALNALELPEAEQLPYLKHLLATLNRFYDMQFEAAEYSFRQASRTLWRLLRRRGVRDTKETYDHVVSDIMEKSASAVELLDRLTFDTAHDRIRAAGRIAPIEEHLELMSYWREYWSGYCDDWFFVVRLKDNPQVLLNWACTQGMGPDVPPHKSAR